jgi:hypothetical protein
MPTDAGGLLLLLLSFVVTFSLGRTISKRVRRNSARKAEEEARRNESRQVRRQRERSKRA